jgi:GDP-L-fucose synthase
MWEGEMRGGQLEDGYKAIFINTTFFLSSENGEDLVVWGSGKPLRQFIYSEDLAALIVWTLEHYEDLSQPLILSVGEEDEVSIKDMAEMIAEAMEFKGKLVVSL